MMRFILFLALLSHAFISLAQVKEFNVYSSFDDEAAKLAEQRLEAALLPLGFQLKMTLLPSKRSLMMANEKGDAELMRVADISARQSQYTSNLIRIDSPVLTVKVFVVSLASLTFPEFDIEQVSQHTMGLEKDVFVLDELFPLANLKDSKANLLRLLQIGKIDAAVIVEQSQGVLREMFNLSEEFNISAIKLIPTHVYVHKKHLAIKDALESSFATYSAADAH